VRSALYLLSFLCDLVSCFDGEGLAKVIASSPSAAAVLEHFFDWKNFLDFSLLGDGFVLFAVGISSIERKEVLLADCSSNNDKFCAPVTEALVVVVVSVTVLLAFVEKDPSHTTAVEGSPTVVVVGVGTEPIEMSLGEASLRPSSGVYMGVASAVALLMAAPLAAAATSP